MSTSKDASLYGFHRQKRMRGDKEISSNTSLSFTSQLSSLIANAPTTASKRSSRPKKEDIFATHNRNTSARAKRDVLDSPAFSKTQQKHTTNGEALERGLWERSKRRMEEKARLYAAMKRGDVEDMEGKYGVDFDRKWAEMYREGDGLEDDDGDDDEYDEAEREMVEYTDEFGRTRQGTRAEAARATRIQRGQEDLTSDRFTARPLAPSSVIYGDTIQHQAFNPDVSVEEQMAKLAKKRDRSLTPPPDTHFDAGAEVRTKGTGFFHFSDDVQERKRQMEELEKVREETERVRADRAKKEPQVDKSDVASYKREADDFLDELAKQMEGGDAGEPSAAYEEAAALVGKKGDVDAMDAMQRIEAALARERVD